MAHRVGVSTREHSVSDSIRYVMQLLFMKNYKIANNSAATEAREKISTYLESLEFQNFFDVCLTKFENY